MRLSIAYKPAHCVNYICSRGLMVEVGCIIREQKDILLSVVIVFDKEALHIPSVIYTAMKFVVLAFVIDPNTKRLLSSCAFGEFRLGLGLPGLSAIRLQFLSRLRLGLIRFLVAITMRLFHAMHMNMMITVVMVRVHGGDNCSLRGRHKSSSPLFVSIWTISAVRCSDWQWR